MTTSQPPDEQRTAESLDDNDHCSPLHVPMTSGDPAGIENLYRGARMSRADLTTQLTLVLDDLLRDPPSPERRAARRRRTPSHLRDQADAAAARVRSVAERATARSGGTSTADMPEWLRLGVAATLASWLTGTGSTCRHDPHPSRPQPVIAAAWRPGLLTCARGTRLLHTATAVADRTCDRCGRVTAGPERGDGMYPGALVVGRLAYLYGTCGDCRADNPDSGRPADSTEERPR